MIVKLQNSQGLVWSFIVHLRDVGADVPVRGAACDAQHHPQVDAGPLRARGRAVRTHVVTQRGGHQPGHVQGVAVLEDMVILYTLISF